MVDERIKNVVATRNQLLVEEKKLCLSTMEKMNAEYKELITGKSFANELAMSCLSDGVDEICRNYYDFTDLYLSPMQLINRVVYFNYDEGGESDEQLRKQFRNLNASLTKNDLQMMQDLADTDRSKLFIKDDKGYIDNEKIIAPGKEMYREKIRNENNGRLHDEITGIKEGDTDSRGKQYRLEVDHVLPTATISTKYVNEKGREALKRYYNSADNYQILEKSANASKGDVRIYEKDGKTYYSRDLKGKDKSEYTDITHRANAEQLTTAVVQRLEDISLKNNKRLTISELEEKNRKNPSKASIERLQSIRKFQAQGLMDEDGNIVEDAQEKLYEKIARAKRGEGEVLGLGYLDYKDSAKSALTVTKASVSKIIAGQIIYYALPPVVFETQQLLTKKNMTLEKFFKEFKKSCKRASRYVISHIGDMIKGVATNSLSKFVNVFFQILINMAKTTVKRMIKMAKRLVLSTVQCAKIITNQNMPAANKADSISKILASSVTMIVIELFTEYLEKIKSIPNEVMEPIQLIITIVATNLVMLVMERADLFNVKHGFIVANVEKIFEQNIEQYRNVSLENLELTKQQNKEILELIEFEVSEISDGLVNLDMRTDDSSKYLKQISEIFQMEIDFNVEWNRFLSVV